MKDIILIDLETTGLDYKKAKIIEFGALKISYKDKEYVIDKEIDEFVSIDFLLSEKIISLTNITDEMLDKNGISEEKLFTILEEYIKDDTLIVAYNLQFDISFLNEFMRKFKGPNFIYKNSLMDVMSMYKDRHTYPHRLCSAIEKYSVEIENTHRAIDDIKATWEVLRKMIGEKDNFDKYINVIGYNKKYGVNGIRIPHISYIAQAGGKREIEKL